MTETRWRLRALLVLMLLLGGYWYWTRDHVEVVDARAGTLVAADTLARVVVTDDVPGAEELLELELRSDGGLTFAARLRRPARIERPLPALLLLAGVGTGRSAASLVPVPRPALRLAIDYPYDAPKEMAPREFLANIPELRSALYDAAAACLVAIDYLAASGEVHPDSLFVVGTSFGAFFGPIATAARGDVDALVIVQGGGNLRRLIDANLRWAGVESFVPLTALAGAALLRPFEPLRWIRRVSPRPLYLVNGRGDERIPTECVDALYEAARDPKRLVWLDAPHVHPSNAALIERLSRTVSGLIFERPRD